MSDSHNAYTEDKFPLIPENGIDPREFAKNNATATTTGFTFQSGSGSSSGTTGNTTAPVKIITNPGSLLQITFPEQGDMTYDITPNMPLTLSLAGGTTGILQRLTVILHQPGEGGIAVSLPSAHYKDGAKPDVSLEAGATTIISYITDDGGKTIYGGL
ncbi:hypothetical protein [Acetobacter sicerae]|uniref:hypothetical protein n=1 Tax=Acetobacter sicerae TaxID=85325 RepID=UPI00156ADF58|nr:hypothetical protein [Acetobacter sicerae]NHN91287.1 hypothetical protein [Acetobacter sicerae]